MWRRVASQSPQVASGPNNDYIKAFTALGKMLRDGRSLSGHERNCCFLNTGDGRFATVSAASGLDFDDDGRAIGLTDWDHDGDLDVWLTNRTAPRLRFMRNDLANSQNFVTVKLTGSRCNRDAVGARLELHLTADDQRDFKLIRTVHAGRGFMSQASKRIHFAAGPAKVKQLVVLWPGGEVERFSGIQSGNHYEITQGTEEAVVWTRPATTISLNPSTLSGTSPTGQARLVVSARLPMPAIDFTSIQSDPKQLADSPTLINLWSTNCMPCIKELNEFSQREAELRKAGVNVLALNVDEYIDDPSSDLSRSRKLLEEMSFPFTAAAINADNSGMLDLFHQAFLSLRLPLPVPSSFLTTADGRVAVIYRGPITVDQLLQDLEVAKRDADLRDDAVPFAGRWYGQPIAVDAKRHATAFMRGGFLGPGAKYLENYLLRHLNKKGWGPRESWPSNRRLAELCDMLANFYRLQNEPKKVVGVYQVALNFDPDFVPSLMNLGKIMVGQGNAAEGLKMLERANRLKPADPIVASDLAIAYAMTGRPKPAEQLFLKLLEDDASSSAARLNLGRLYFQSGRFSESAAQLKQYLKHDPTSVEALRSLCWILVCSPQQTDRDLRLAQSIMSQRLTKLEKGTAELYDLRAAMYAEVGDFKRAVESATRAIQVAKQQGNTALVSEAQKRRQLYLNQRPYRL